MIKIFKDYLTDFDVKFKDLDFIDKSFHEKELGVVSFASKANCKDTNWNFSEEYIWTRFVYALVNSGFFLLNGGGLGNDLGKIYYLAPDSLEFEPLDLSYSEFLLFCFNNDLDDFYKGLRWKNWKSEVSKLNGDTVFNFFPYLWTKEGKNIEKNSKKEIPIEEQYNFIMGFIKK